MKGYMVIAQNNKKVNYIRQAYALALSIKNTQSKINRFCICVEKESDIPDEYRYVFDDIVEIPWNDDAKDSIWKIGNKWKYYYMSPYDETIVLDTDMLFTEDISHWWDFLSKRDVWFTSNVLTYRGEIVESDHYRKTFTSNNLPNIYTAFFYFKTSFLMAQIARMTDSVFRDWPEYYNEYLHSTRPTKLSGDVAYALAVKILGVEHECISDQQIPTFVHMKAYVQDVPEEIISEDWERHFQTYFSEDGQLRVYNYRQRYPFHYHRKEWLTDTIIDTLETIYGRTKRTAQKSSREIQTRMGETAATA